MWCVYSCYNSADNFPFFCFEDHFKESIEKNKPTVSKEDLAMYEEFTHAHGTSPFPHEREDDKPEKYREIPMEKTRSRSKGSQPKGQQRRPSDKINNRGSGKRVAANAM
jgi:hypothetical protein